MRPDHDAPEELATVQHHTPTFATVHATAIFDPRLSAAQFRIYSALCLYANTQNYCWPKLDTLADLLGISKPAISRTIKQLAAQGYVTVERRGFPARNVYRVHRSRVNPTLTLEAETDARVNVTLTKSKPHVNSRVNVTLTHTNRPIEQTKENNSVDDDLSIPSHAPKAPPERRTRERGFDTAALKRDPLTLAFIACLGHEPATRREWGQWRIAVNDCHASGITAADIPRAIQGYQTTYPKSRITPLAIVGHWSEIWKGKSHDVAQLEISRRAAEAATADKRERERADAERKAQERAEVERLLSEYGYTDGSGNFARG